MRLTSTENSIAEVDAEQPLYSTGVFLQCPVSKAEATTVDSGIAVFERSRA